LKTVIPTIRLHFPLFLVSAERVQLANSIAHRRWPKEVAGAEEVEDFTEVAEVDKPTNEEEDVVAVADEGHQDPVFNKKNWISAPGCLLMVRKAWMVQGWTFIVFSANNAGASTPRGNGRGRGRGGQVFGSNSGTNTPNRGRGRGFDSPRGRGRGQPDDFRNRRRSDGIGSSPISRGRGGAQVPPGTLSGLLYLERPLLRPIVFVPSVLTKVLFEQEEELIKPGVEDVGKCTQIFAEK
jgi:hypothetical protein